MFVYLPLLSCVYGPLGATHSTCHRPSLLSRRGKSPLSQSSSTTVNNHLLSARPSAVSRCSISWRIRTYTYGPHVRQAFKRQRIPTLRTVLSIMRCRRLLMVSFSTGSSSSWDKSSTAFSRSLEHGSRTSAQFVNVTIKGTHAWISSKICFWLPGVRKYAIAYDHLSVRRHFVSSSTAVCMKVACASRISELISPTIQ